MNPKIRSVLSVIFVSTAPLSALGGSLECQGNIISPGVTEQQLLEACGNPTSRNGAEWIYEIPGSLPMAVTLGNGTVMFIRDATELDSPAAPLGDSP